MAKIIDGKAIANRMLDLIKARVETLASRPRLAVILVGNDPASNIYVDHKIKACRRVGIETISARLDPDTTEESLLGIIDGFNSSGAFTGILVQLPLPEQIAVKHIIEAIDPMKDVDGFHPLNVGRLAVRSQDPYLHPCTPFGIMHMLDTVYHRKVEGASGLTGKKAIVIGQSYIVGRPLSVMLQNEGATVTMCDKNTPDLMAEARGADIIVSATGVHGLITPELVEATGKPETLTVIDAGITKVDGKIVGDCAPGIEKMVGAITPVPGGVGPVTIAFLMRNVIKAHCVQRGLPLFSGK